MFQMSDSSLMKNKIFVVALWHLIAILKFMNELALFFGQTKYELKINKKQDSA